MLWFLLILLILMLATAVYVPLLLLAAVIVVIATIHHFVTLDWGNKNERARTARVHYSQLGWRERDEEEAARAKASSDQALNVFLGVWFLTVVIGGFTLGVIGLIVGAFVGFFAAGIVIAFVYP